MTTLSTHLTEGEKNKCHSIKTAKFVFWKEISAYWKFKGKISVPNQHNCCDIVLGKFLSLVINLLRDWSTENTAVCFCKKSAFCYKYVLNKILGIRLVVVYKYINCNVDKTTGIVTGHPAYLYNNTLILFMSSCYRPLKLDPSGEMCIWAICAKPFFTKYAPS